MRNHHTKTACATGALTLALAMPALADSDQQVTRQMLSEADRIAIFGEDSNFQVALLTDEEMAETKGALAWGWLGHWSVRTTFGTFVWGYMRGRDLQGESAGMWRMYADYMVMGAVGGLLSVNAPLAAVVGLTQYEIDRIGGPIRVWHLFRRRAEEAGRNFGESLAHLESEARRLAVETFRRLDGDADADALSTSSSSGVSADDSFLQGLTDGLDRVALRTFFSSVPEGTLNSILARIPAQTRPTRTDFLANLSSDNVNRVLLRLPDENMISFINTLAPERYREALSAWMNNDWSNYGAASGSATSLSLTPPEVHWIY